MLYPLPQNIESKVDLKHSLLIKRDDGIVEIRCANHFTYDTEHIMENHVEIKKMAGSERMLILNIAPEHTDITHGARSYIAKGIHKDFILAEAFLVNSLPQRLLANFFVKLNNPIVPAAYFAYEYKDIAEKWLLEQRSLALEKHFNKQ